MKNKIFLSLVSILSFSLISCGESNISSVYESSNLESSTTSASQIEQTSSEAASSDEIISSSEISSTNEVSSSGETDIKENFDFSKFASAGATVEEMSDLPSYTPTTFNVSTYSETKTSLGDGVDMYTTSFNVEDGQTNPVYIVVDLTKASIAAGSYNNTTNKSEYTKKSTPYEMALAYERDHTDRKVIAATNADYFAWGDDGQCINAFVKDGVVLKANHNYDLNDVPVSSPMLFGISSAGARIGKISTNENYSENLKSSLYTTSSINIISSDGIVTGTYEYKEDSGVLNSGIGLLKTVNEKKGVGANARAYKYHVIQKDKCENGEIRAYISEELPVSASKSYVEVTEDDGYVVISKNSPEITINVGDYINVTNVVNSNGGEWNCYQDILGARHSLVEDGNIPASLANESQNSAQSRVARTAIGIRPDGKVVLVSVEGNGKGMNLPQLGDFMRYIGCYDACNFDGGGSSQLIRKDGLNGEGNFIVQNRSSDYNTYNPNDSRKVLNSVLIVTK